MRLLSLAAPMLIIARSKRTNVFSLLSKHYNQLPLRSCGRNVLTLKYHYERRCLSCISNGEEESTKRHQPTKYLVCGDGDLSFSASISRELAKKDIHLTATVLEDQDTHHKVYQNSRQNFQQIMQSQSIWGTKHEVLFGVDATNLTKSFGNETHFDRIQFNFPHWRGKTNNRRNKNLLSEFLGSASKVLSPCNDSEIHVALCHGQGGSSSSDVQQWRQSWTAAQIAAEHGLLLRNVAPFTPQYAVSSHRGVDRPFPVGEKPELYIFDNPGNCQEKKAVEEKLQLCCRHELHIVMPSYVDSSSTLPLPSTSDDNKIKQINEIIHGDFILNLAKSIVSNGVRVEVPARRLVSPLEFQNSSTSIIDIENENLKSGDWNADNSCSIVMVYVIVYAGERTPLTRDMANDYRSRLESNITSLSTTAEFKNIMTLRQNRKGRPVSRPFPYPTLKPEQLHWYNIDQNLAANKS